MTNFLHLAELLQNASTQLDGEQALVRWLGMQIDEGRSGSEEQIVRLESDADLVKVVTVHKSKGLEYPVVCLPFAASHRKVDPARTPFVHLLDEDGQRRLVLNLSDPAVKEVILAVNATVDGQTTAHYVTDRLDGLGVKVTRLAHGVPVGGELDYLDEGTLTAAIRSRTPF